MPTQPTPDEDLQLVVDALQAYGTKAAAARALKMPGGTFDNRVRAAKLRGLTSSVQRLVGTEAAPQPGLKLKGTSTLYDDQGVARLQWVKTNADMEQLEAVQRTVLAAMLADLKPCARIPAPRTTIAELLNLYTITDSHVGMLAWKKETGESWDLEIAEKCLTDTFLRMIESAPPARVGIINQLGDFLHFDSLIPMTPTNHHVLDADSRYQKVVEVAVRILRRLVNAALAKHAYVRVYMHEGNHDPAGSVWLRVMFSELYGNNPRVHVEKSPLPYTCYLHGQTLLGFHHGHMTKLVNLPQIFAARFRKEWGRATHTYIHTGHKHHVEEKEHPGVNVIQHATLSAPDAYAVRGGWLSKRQATSMTYHTTRGEIARAIFVPEPVNV